MSFHYVNNTGVKNTQYRLTTYKNSISTSRLEIHPEVRGIDANNKEGSDNNVHSHHDGEEYSDPDQDEVSNNIDDEGVEDGENLQSISVGHSSRGIILGNDLGADMLSVDPDAAHTLEFP
ncbi:hypothetical protein GOBAR_DD18138 [Gossypium barbadense]|nr:hypothetical protein GOBAR_DD18138 [Gossypium barbadense]